MLSYDVILPFYNDYKYLKRSLSLLSSQILLPNNLIFIDDGNNDNNLKKYIINNLNTKINLIYINNITNIGSTESINLGLKKVLSNFFFIYATDDIIYKNFAIENINVLKKHPNHPFAFSNIVINNEIKNKKFYIEYSFLKKKNFNKDEVKTIFKNHQFKIYHNTVFFKTDYFLRNNIYKKDYGVRCDMLNLYFLSFNYGFIFINKNLSEFTVRKGQQGVIKDDQYLFNELIYIKKNQKKFYKNYIKNYLHYDFSPMAIFLFLNNKLYEVISLKWFIRSIKFRIWKKIRFLIPSFMLNLIFKLFN